ncbi:isopentenyl transferase family protein [Streptomyces sp. NPDC004539]|uniref:isopentenyl transferase family protein n=1 Tax=Streptomyces sp. NPDC004539 TaxID=3154280 RepID=UPI0033A9B5B0
MTRSDSREPLPVHLIAGPTGVGKSAVASGLAQHIGAPVVVADRIQCFTDLATTSARAGADVPGVERVRLGDRTVADGDYPADQAARCLVEQVERLGQSAPAVIIEGGSISLVTLLVRGLPRLPWSVTTQFLVPPADPGRYLKALTERAHAMLRPRPRSAGSDTRLVRAILSGPGLPLERRRSGISPRQARGHDRAMSRGTRGGPAEGIPEDSPENSAESPLDALGVNGRR